MNRVKIEGYKDLSRDPSSGGILNTNTGQYESYIKLKRSKEIESKKIDTLETEIVSMKESIDEIKNLLRSLIDGSK